MVVDPVGKAAILTSMAQNGVLGGKVAGRTEKSFVERTLFRCSAFFKQTEWISGYGASLRRACCFEDGLSAGRDPAI
jgi:hypothetical protein